MVLLTAMEYLREEEAKEKDVELNEEDPHAERREAIGSDEKEVKESDITYEPEQHETWVSMNKQPVKANAMEKLLFIGGLLLHL